MRAKDAMTRNVVWVIPELRLADAAAVMDEWEIRHLPVMAGGEPVGILSDRDVLLRSRVLGDGSIAIDPVSVGEAMTPNPEKCTPRSNLASIATVMTERKIDSLLVVDDGELVGLVTSTDLLQVLVLREREARLSDLPLRFNVVDSGRGTPRAP